MQTSSRRSLLIVLFLFATGPAWAQVRGIKASALTRHVGEGGAGYGYVVYLLADMLTSGVVDWQTATLKRRTEIPTIVSLEILGQLAAQPSIYYVFQPRVRGNWGIFVSDFRINYVVEKVHGGVEDLRTNDWQILGLNVVNEQALTVRISTGIMHEHFGEGRVFNESVAGMTWRAPSGTLGAMSEYRWAKDFGTGEKPRIEFNCSVYRTVLRTSNFDLSLTAGGLYQEYNSTVPVWGLQGGLLTRIF